MELGWGKSGSEFDEIGVFFVVWNFDCTVPNGPKSDSYTCRVGKTYQAANGLCLASMNMVICAGP